ncbi:hypothetical protein [Paraburkholderia sp. BL21I4N1]|uniref:hypothetical protein n=1 Tax=Paraburkholderia sp. BL21I4N1 TaxID=1938801 RepID=UPI000CFD988B|nr:hypothetical protein [Paraburkholderia sp. BL21I4N1]PQV48052.1 hypothetical protein B0G83_109138 [Paraburkholderia sp. BL21I4N1]
MSAPESSNSKAPPSLLSDKAKGADANGSRILANLEGRVAPPTEKSRRSRAPLLLVALLVIAAGGWGAWHMQQRQHDETLAAATSPAPGDAEKPAATAAVPASASAQVVAKAPAAPVPASSQAATIIADDSDSKTAASAPAPASGADRLSRALADGAEPSSAPTPVASATSASAVPVPAAKHGKSATALAGNSKHEATHGKKESVTASTGNRHASTPSAVAQSKKQRASGTASKDDSDADLLAALVARTKPADAKPSGGTATTKVSATAPANAKLAERVKECGQRGFFEDQLCRWRVCDGHWGKDPACPGASPQARQP